MSLAFWRKRAPHRTGKPAPVPSAPPSSAQPAPSVGPVTPIRVTSDIDGEILNRGYPYWSQLHVEPDGRVLCFVAHADGRPRFFRVDLSSGYSIRLGPMVNYRGGEGWAFTPSGDLMLCDGPRLRRVNPITGADTVVMDCSESSLGCDIWQSHSSDNGLVHSATVRRIVTDGAYPKLGTIVQRDNVQRFFPALGVLDESHLTSDGSYLLIEESDDNRIIDLASGAERRLTNAEGALSHIDCGPGYAVGEDDQRGACTYLDLRTLERRVLFNTWNQGHVSVRAGKCLLSDAEKLSLVALDGSGVRPIANHGMRSDGSYDTQVFGSLSPDGTVAAYVSNMHGRNDLYLVRT